MKGFYKVFVAIFILSISLTFFSCSQKSSASFNYNARRNNQSTIDPVSRKTTPVRKKFIIKNKRRHILGQKKPI